MCPATDQHVALTGLAWIHRRGEVPGVGASTKKAS